MTAGPGHRPVVATPATLGTRLVAAPGRSPAQPTKDTSPILDLAQETGVVGVVPLTDVVVDVLNERVEPDQGRKHGDLGT